MREYGSFAEYLKRKRERARDVHFDSDEESQQLPQETSERAEAPPPLLEATADVESAPVASTSQQCDDNIFDDAGDAAEGHQAESSSSEDVNVATVEEIAVPDRVEKGKTIDDFGSYIVTLQARHKLSKTVATNIIDYLRNNSETLGPGLMNNELPSFKVLLGRELQQIPVRYLDLSCNKPDGSELLLEGLQALPQKRLQQEQLRLRYELSYVRVSDVATKSYMPVGRRQKRLISLSTASRKASLVESASTCFQFSLWTAGTFMLSQF